MNVLYTLLRTGSKQSRFLATVVGALGAAMTLVAAEHEAGLRVEVRPDGAVFRLRDAGGGGPWVLQHSPDGRTWSDLQFLVATGEGGEVAGTEIQWEVLAEPGARQGLFRAVQLEEDNAFLRKFLTERAKWRLSGIDDYQYALRQGFGQISWNGVVKVADGEVASFETIDLQPPVVGVPEVPSIDRLFDRIAGAIAANASTIDVTWHTVYGYPISCFIDLHPLLADEESGWTIERFTLTP